jgi:hypothetical protein
MRRSLAAATAGVIFGLVGVITVRTSSAQIEQLNQKIPAPDRAKYRAVRDARKWRNPIITIRAEGIEVESHTIPSGRRTVAPEELRGLLIILPLDAWPYGRVVLASDIGLRRVDRSDDEPIKRNHEAAEKTLKALKIDVEWSPSA